MRAAWVWCMMGLSLTNERAWCVCPSQRLWRLLGCQVQQTVQLTPLFSYRVHSHDDKNSWGLPVSLLPPSVPKSPIAFDAYIVLCLVCSTLCTFHLGCWTYNHSVFTHWCWKWPKITSLQVIDVKCNQILHAYKVLVAPPELSLAFSLLICFFFKGGGTCFQGCRSIVHPRLERKRSIIF